MEFACDFQNLIMINPTVIFSFGSVLRYFHHFDLHEFSQYAMALYLFFQVINSFKVPSWICDCSMLGWY